jgi:hypothetical protein
MIAQGLANCTGNTEGLTYMQLDVYLYFFNGSNYVIQSGSPQYTDTSDSPWFLTQVATHSCTANQTHTWLTVVYLYIVYYGDPYASQGQIPASVKCS